MSALRNASLDVALLRLRSALRKSAQKSLSRNASAGIAHGYYLRSNTALAVLLECSKFPKLQCFRRAVVQVLPFYSNSSTLYTTLTIRLSTATTSLGVTQISSKIPKPKCFRRHCARILPSLQHSISRPARIPKLKYFRRAVVQVLPFSIHQYYFIRTVNASAGITHDTTFINFARHRANLLEIT